MPTALNPNEWVSITEGADMLGWKYHRFLAAIRRGRIPEEATARFGWARVVKRSAVEEFKKGLNQRRN